MRQVPSNDCNVDGKLRTNTRKSIIDQNICPIPFLDDVAFYIRLSPQQRVLFVLDVFDHNNDILWYVIVIS